MRSCRGRSNVGEGQFLLGRDAELARIDAAIEAARGGLRVVFLEGEAGIGKSRLLPEAARVADDAGFALLRSKAEEIRGDRPFALIADLLASGARPRETGEPLRG